jgi:ribonuclease BN (tRNA processing enzyme)
MLEFSPKRFADELLGRYKRLILFGEPGMGKSTLAAEIAKCLDQKESTCGCICADSGSPVFGLPGAVSYGEWSSGAWKVIRMEAICSLDAGRFRLPLISAVRRLAGMVENSVLLIDPPGVVRGVAAAELLQAMVEAVEADALLLLTRKERKLPLETELPGLGCPLFVAEAAQEARRPSKKERARSRTKLWNDYLQSAGVAVIPWESLPITGTSPPLDLYPIWQGRQIALLDGKGSTLQFGEVESAGEQGLTVRLPHPEMNGSTQRLLVRDAHRGESGLITTARPFPAASLRYTPPGDILPSSGIGSVGGPRPVVSIGSAVATLVNGVFGDPLMHLRLRYQRRSMLFDLGEAGRLPAKVAHQVSELFISHTHIDHIGGFLWLVRSRIGEFPPCRVFGPPGLVENIQGILNGIHWDRIEDRGPCFEVAELHGDLLVRAMLQAGRRHPQPMASLTVEKGILLDDPAFLVRAATLDHGIPVLAFSFESKRQFNVCKNRLLERDLAPGPWLNELKRLLSLGELKTRIHLPDGTTEEVGELGGELIRTTPGRKLVYATDLADTLPNRERLVALAEGAHTLFCEAAFLADDRERADNTQHLTTTACGEIATAGGVERLVPFHFSRRYEREPERIYEEVAAACRRTLVPRREDFFQP